VGALGICILVFNIYSIVMYTMYIPPAKKKLPQGELGHLEEEEEGVSCSILLSIFSGAKHVLRNRPVAWRLVFFALEISLEDTMVALVCANYGMLIMAPQDSIHGNFWSNILIASSKVGGVITGCYMNIVWTEAGGKSYKTLFRFCALGGLSALLVPISTWQFGTEDAEHHVIRDACVFASLFLFFLFTTAPKIGFGALLQELVGETEHTGLIFGFVSAFITITDSLVLMGFSFCFEYLSVQNALWVTCGAFTVVGIAEWLLGPTLFLPKTYDHLSDAHEPMNPTA